MGGWVGGAGGAMVGRRWARHVLEAAEPAGGGGGIAKRAEAEGNVHAFGDERLPLIVDQQHDPQLWVTPEKIIEPRNDRMLGEAGGGRYAQDAAQFSGAARREVGFVERGEDRFHAREVLGARFGQ